MKEQHKMPMLDCPSGGEAPEPERSSDIDTSGAALPSVPAQPVVLSDEQEEFITAVFDGTGPNVLLLGKAGVGKSLATRSLLERAKALGVSYLHGAPTGVAAINVGGSTVHSLIQTLSRGRGAAAIGFCLVDEAPMMRADLFDELDRALRYSQKCPEQPFGGVKMVLCGDPFQLPPVMKDGDAETEMVKDNYFTPYFFSAACYARAQWKVIELTKIFRQKSEGFAKLLNLIRVGESARPAEYLNRKRKTTIPQGVILTSTNKSAEEINATQLQKLPDEIHTFTAEVWGKIRPNEYPAEETFRVKLGAKVMIIKNIYAGVGEERILRLVNGDVGIVSEIGEAEVYDESLDKYRSEPFIEIDVKRTGETHRLFRAFWQKEERVYDRDSKTMTREVVASFVQFPVRLAWAITIHKSQGATIEELTLDVRRPLFATGQAYVALSRGVSLEGVWIWGTLREKDVMVCPDALEFSRGYTKGVGIKPGSQFDEKWIEGKKKKQTELFSAETTLKPESNDDRLAALSREFDE